MVVGAWLAAAFALREALVRALQTAANLLASLREGDDSVRARDAGRDDALGELHAEVNALADALRSERLRELEASELLAPRGCSRTRTRSSRALINLVRNAADAVRGTGGGIALGWASRGPPPRAAPAAPRATLPPSTEAPE